MNIYNRPTLAPMKMKDWRYTAVMCRKLGQHFTAYLAGDKPAHFPVPALITYVHIGSHVVSVSHMKGQGKASLWIRPFNEMYDAYYGSAS